MVRAEQQLSPSRPARAHEARRPDLSLAAVNRWRAQLWAISVALVVAATGVIALLTARPDLLPSELRVPRGSAWVITVLFGGLGLAFLLYVWEKERSLRKLTNALVEERVRSASLDNRIQEMARLSEVARSVNSSIEQADIFDSILSSALELLACSEGAIMLLDEEGAELKLAGHKGPGPTIASGAPSAISAVMTQRVPVLVNASDEGPEEEASSEMCVPLIRDGELLGVLSMKDTDAYRRFTMQDLDALGFFAEHAAIALGNARLFMAERATVERLEELDRLKSDFVATVSHELRTPLTAIIGAAKTVAKKGPTMPTADLDVFMGVINRQADRLLKLVQEVLQASRMESAQPRLNREQCDLADIAHDVISAFSHTILGDGRRIAFEATPKRPHTWGDPVALEQIFTNLIENALKYSAGDVTVIVSESESETTIEVADSGVGMTSEQLETVFERYRQIDVPAHAGGSGFGLGLFITRNLVDAHNGTIEVLSEPGAGSCFIVHLPKRTTDG